jgi:mRNA-degrading endonuclease toxin of MazEF toxin-antitoxin module
MVTTAFRQGDIHDVHLDDSVASRPVVVISRTEVNAQRMSIVIALITTTVRDMPVEIPVGKTEGLEKNGVINLGDIHTLSQARFGERKGCLSAEKIERLQDGLKLLFAVP